VTHDIARTAPAHNKIASLEAEQALLGAILFDNETINRVIDLAPEEFYDPVHGRIFAQLRAMIAQGELADAITLKEHFAKDGGIAEIGGAKYLMTLLENAAVLSTHAFNYAELIRDLAVRRRIVEAGENAIMLGKHPPHEVSCDALVARAVAGFDTAQPPSAAHSCSLAEAAENFLLSLDEPKAQAITTGLPKLDKRLGGGLFRGDLVILGGRPSMGKTALANNIARCAAKSGLRVAMFSAEMTAESLAMRALAAAQYWRTEFAFDRFAYAHLRQGAPNINRSHLAAAAKDLLGLKLEIDDRAGLSVAQIEHAARAIRRKLGGLDLVVIDYLQILDLPHARGLNLSAVIGEATKALKVMARKLNVAVLVLSQLSRQLESRDDKRPQLSDLRESGNIEQDADVVLFAYREEYYLDRSEPRDDGGGGKLHEWMERKERARDVMEIITAKQRQGPVGSDSFKALVQYDLILDVSGG
jgi:replicative DNA helicase